MAEARRTYGEMADAGEPVSEVFSAVLDLHRALKEAPVKDRLWRYTWTQDGREYTLALNGRLGQTVESIPPLHVAVEVDGWLRVLTDPFHGSVVGPAGTETLVWRAIRDETARVGRAA